MRLIAFFFLATLAGCGHAPPQESSGCGPSDGTVVSVIDGDTVTLKDGRRVRYLLVDTPESMDGSEDCFGKEAKSLNTSLVIDQDVTLEFDLECFDSYGRTLAYVSVNNQSINERLIARGFARVLHVPPNGNDRVDHYQQLAAEAKAQNLGLWGECT